MKRAAVFVVALVLGFALYAPAQTSQVQAKETVQPNIVFIMLDDISTGYMDAMPNARSLIGSRGVVFRNGLTPTSLCCPSRASVLSGKLAHTTGVYTNEEGTGGWWKFQAQEDNTIATHLHDAGYHTGLIGKYLNGFRTGPEDYVPAGWDEFQAFRTTNYYNWTLGGTVQESYGSMSKDYSTDVLADKAVQFVKQAPEDKPLFLYFSPYSAHAPMKPAPRHIGTWHNERLDGAFDEKDMSDKPKFMRKKPLLGHKTRFKTIQRRQHEMLMSADEGISDIFDALGDRVSNTLFVLMGDNGYLLGSHRLEGKNYPYARSAEVPMMMRMDGVVNSSLAGRLTTNVDLTATMAEVAGVSWPMDGKSVLSSGRHGTVMEQTAFHDVINKRHPAYCGYRTKGWLFVKWSGQARQELYRYRTDPYELNNLAVRPFWDAKRKKLRQQAKAACVPVPPGFSW
jgi:N-acetylglucosamine-6-sulfatase